jgi:molybdate-binding protein
VRVIDREEGSGAQAMLDLLLAAESVPPSAVGRTAITARSHTQVARAVASGSADVGVSSACVAAAYGLGFLPQQTVRYDLAFRTAYLQLEPVRRLLATLHHRWVRSQLAVLGGYDLSRTGEAVATIVPAPSTGGTRRVPRSAQ